MEKKSHFVLVHGASHGAWCWYKVATMLEAEGHKVTALDMAASGANPMRPEEVRSRAVYTKPLTDFMEGLAAEERVVLVSHSFGFVNIMVAMEAFPHKISLAVFTGALPSYAALPQSSRIIEQERDVYKEFLQPRLNCGGFVLYFDDGLIPTAMLFNPAYLATNLYQLSPPEDLTLGLMSVRPMPTRINVIVPRTVENYGSVPRVFVAGENDLMLKNWSPEDMDHVIPGADHMLMFSKPRELTSYLQDIAAKYN